MQQTLMIRLTSGKHGRRSTDWSFYQRFTFNRSAVVKFFIKTLCGAAKVTRPTPKQTVKKDFLAKVKEDIVQFVSRHSSTARGHIRVFAFDAHHVYVHFPFLFMLSIDSCTTMMTIGPYFSMPLYDNAFMLLLRELWSGTVVTWVSHLHGVPLWIVARKEWARRRNSRYEQSAWITTVWWYML